MMRITVTQNVMAISDFCDIALAPFFAKALSSCPLIDYVVKRPELNIRFSWAFLHLAFVFAVQPSVERCPREF
ncbi:hypothetical protein DZ11F43_24740 [Escherichia coli]